MKDEFSTGVAGWLFVVGSAMLWLGWMLMPVRIGAFFHIGDFSAILRHRLVWIWLYRMHIFGFLILVMALVALGGLIAETPARILVWPGIAVAIAGLIVGALAAAFYYHFGAWGAVETTGASAEDLRRYVESLRNETEYVTCLVRFSRVFFGLGLLVLALGLARWNALPRALCASAVVLGLASMALTMAFADHLEFYAPLFHLNAAWLLATGVMVIRLGKQQVT